MEDLLTVEQAAAKLQVSPKTVKDWLRAGRITGVRVGKLWRLREADVAAFVQPGTVQPRRARAKTED